MTLRLFRIPTSVMDLFQKDDDIAGRLQDLDVIVVAARDNRHLAVNEQRS